MTLEFGNSNIAYAGLNSQAFSNPTRLYNGSYSNSSGYINYAEGGGGIRHLINSTSTLVGGGSGGGGAPVYNNDGSPNIGTGGFFLLPINFFTISGSGGGGGAYTGTNSSNGGWGGGSGGDRNFSGNPGDFDISDTGGVFGGGGGGGGQGSTDIDENIYTNGGDGAPGCAIAYWPYYGE